MIRKLGLLVLVLLTLCLGQAAAQQSATRAEILDAHRRAKALAETGDVPAAIAAYETLLVDLVALPRPWPEAAGLLQSELAELYGRKGDHRRVLELRRDAARTLRAALPLGHVRLLLAEVNLGVAANNEQQMDEAADAFGRAVAGADRLTDPKLTALRWLNRGFLGQILLYQEQPQNALALLEQAVAHGDELKASGDAVLWCGFQVNLGEALSKLRQYETAEAELEAARSCYQQEQAEALRLADADAQLALALVRQRKLEAAMAAAHAAAARARAALGDPRQRRWGGEVLRHTARVALEAGDLPMAFQWLLDRSPLVDPSSDAPLRENPARDRIEFAELLVDSAEYWFGIDDVQASTTYARWALESLKTRASRIAAGGRGGDEGERRRVRQVASRMVEVMAATPATRKGREQLWTNELLQIAQVAHATAAGQAIAQMAGRLAAGNDALAALLAARRDAALNWSRADLALSAAMAQGVGGAGLSEIQRQRDAAGVALAEIDARLAAEFPQAARHAGFTILPSADIQAQLRADEAVLFYQVGEKRSAVWTITPESVWMTSLAIGAVELEAMVAQLRQGVDPARVRGVDALPEFDARLAWKLYQRLVRPIGGELSRAAPKARHLMIVPDGPLYALPFQILVAGNFDDIPDQSRLAEARWFVRDYAISALPSIAALAALRSEARASRATQPFLGVGDPLLGSRDGAARGGDLAFGDGAASWLRGARSVGAEGAVDRLYRGGQVDVAVLRQLPSLPDTAIELAALARSLKAPADSLRLRDEARETPLKRRDALKDYRVLAFATHGVTAGELRGAAEPGLVLTPPAQASELDDGLLTAGEVAGLDLDADWVVLSACNTAAGDGEPGAQGLSGLARAFFLAGSRSLLVSHWPVFSKPAVRLTTTMMAELEAEPGLARAEAQRRAMLEMIADRDHPFLAHPVFWAPFSVVGEGGALTR